MNGMMGYAQLLRAIGQALETLNIQSFEMEPVGGDFFIRGNVLSTSAELLDSQLISDKLRRAIWGKLPHESGGNGKDTDATSPTVHSPVELLYGVKDIERLEEEGRSKRLNPQGTANPSSLSQVLRCIGAYLNQKRARLLKLSREAESVAVEYETSLGTTIKEILSLSDLYDLWVRMYLQRAERTSP
ncbi:MAG TPA: hypothetical protein VGW77_16470 [Candidatus Binatia bacterium]|nr:hypothetical protein [Candidatus Binatia bacterium]